MRSMRISARWGRARCRLAAADLRGKVAPEGGERDGDLAVRGPGDGPLDPAGPGVGPLDVVGSGGESGEEDGGALRRLPRLAGAEVVGRC